MTTLIQVNHNKKPEDLNAIEFKLSTNESIHYKYTVNFEDKLIDKKINYVFSISKEEIQDCTITRVLKYSQNSNEVIKCIRIIDRCEYSIEEPHKTAYYKVDDLYINFYFINDWNACYYHFINNISDRVKKLIPNKSNKMNGILRTYNLQYKPVYLNNNAETIVGITHKLMPNKPTKMFFEFMPMTLDRMNKELENVVRALKLVFGFEEWKIIMMRTSLSSECVTHMIIDNLIMPSLSCCADVAEELRYDARGINFDVYKPGSYLSQIGSSKRKMKPLIVYNSSDVKGFKYYCLQPDVKPEEVTFLAKEYEPNFKEGKEIVEKFTIPDRYRIGITVTKRYNDEVVLCNVTKQCPMCKSCEPEHNYIVKKDHMQYLGCMKTAHTHYGNVTRLEHNVDFGNVDLPTPRKLDKNVALLNTVIKKYTLANVEEINESKDIGPANKKRALKLRYASLMLKYLLVVDNVDSNDVYEWLRNQEYNCIPLERLQRAFIRLYDDEKIDDLQFKKLIYKDTANSKLPKVLPSQYNWKQMITTMKHLLDSETYDFIIQSNRPYKNKAITSINLIKVI